MRRVWNRAAWWVLTAASLAGVGFMVGCDEQTRATLESGVIDASSSLLAAILQAVIAVAGEASATTTMILLGC